MIQKVLTLFLTFATVALQASLPPAKAQKTESTIPDLQWGSFQEVDTASAGDSVTYYFNVINGGTGYASYSYVQGFFSEDGVWDSQDPLIGSSFISTMNPGQSRNGSITFTLASDLEDGTYYIWFVIAATNRVNESNENNNIYIAAIEIDNNQSTPAYGIDLQSVNPTILNTSTGSPTTALQLGSSVTLNADTWNAGTVSALSSKMQAFLSSDNVLGAGDQLLATFDVPPVHAGQVKRDPYNRTVTLPQSWPTSQGFIIFKADAWQHVYETNENNNTLAVAVSLASSSKRKTNTSQASSLSLKEALASFSQPNIEAQDTFGSAFDAAGRLLVERAGTTDETNYFYREDAPNFVLVAYSNGDIALRQLSQSGLVLSETSEDARLVFEYDSFGKLIRIQND